MAKILGLSFYFHDSAAALVVDGRIAAAAQEERFCRRKHTNEFPKLSVEYCLEVSKVRSINEIDAIVYYEKPVTKLFRVVETMLDHWPRTYSAFVQQLPSYLSHKINVEAVIRDHLPRYKGKVLFSGHHLSHAASAFYCSPFEEAAILTVDGVGEKETVSIGVGKGNQIRTDQVIEFPHSVGLLYSAVTSYLGFKVNDGEWKVMGLAPYGKPSFRDKLERLVRFESDGSFGLNMDYFDFPHSSRCTVNPKKWELLLGFSARRPDEPLTQVHQDLARSGQQLVEDLLSRIATHIHGKYHLPNLVIAGGVGLNSVANWKIQKLGLFQRVWIQPAPGDDGGALGAAMAVSHMYYDEPRGPAMDHAYWGPEFSDDEIQDYLDRNQIVYEHLRSAGELVDRVSGLLEQKKVLGWFQGRMEFGPRALGSRSILASAADASMKDLINKKVKFREGFRPFAPAVPLENVHEYFDAEPGEDFPFMLKVPQVRVDKRHLIPAVTHEDGSGRVQTVTESSNPIFHDLLTRYGARTGVPILINTSFNVRGEPIVCTPEDAYRCYAYTDIDALVMGSFVITEKPSARFTDEERFRRSNAMESGAEADLPSDSKEPAVFSAERKADDDSGLTRSVLNFYKELPFNYYSGAIDMAVSLTRSNRVKSYPPLHRELKRVGQAEILDVGSGAGWFVNSCSVYYPKNRYTGLEINPKAVKQAESVSRVLGSSNADFVRADLFDYAPGRKFKVVNSLGVLHHTYDCHRAIRQCVDWIEEGGYLHLGLYHLYGRRPFLRHFRSMQEKGANEETLFAEFKNMNPDMDDPTHLRSWFRDQVMHPHETQHTFEEIHALLDSLGLKTLSTSINRFGKIGSVEELVRMEKSYEAYSVRMLLKKRYFPGFFTVWARKDKV